VTLTSNGSSASLGLIVAMLVAFFVAIVDGRREHASTRRVPEVLREARLVAAQWRAGLDVDSLANAAGRALGHR
jgi:hypothetical protein